MCSRRPPRSNLDIGKVGTEGLGGKLVKMNEILLALALGSEFRRRRHHVPVFPLSAKGALASESDYRRHVHCLCFVHLCVCTSFKYPGVKGRIYSICFLMHYNLRNRKITTLPMSTQLQKALKSSGRSKCSTNGEMDTLPRDTTDTSDNCTHKSFCHFPFRTTDRNCGEPRTGKSIESVSNKPYKSAFPEKPLPQLHIKQPQLMV
ncbi:uncharacterized protein C8R40DRAFT_737645 [Lentinula edodes]|uniref:uncharacterized protein n=1 Tax=Lentinula edodes TaxID=5353 RepID=UPI001E8EC27C|nr:uncharacterized protein C8R40DRAFT_737645 [Lentinula edodes]KAH7869509.1 hypothetical protein C8R40DRAFT_737645 [Lentinula edodes]